MTLLKKEARRAPEPSVLTMRGGRRLASIGRRLPAWLALLLVFATVLAVTGRPTAPGIRDLSGPWRLAGDEEGEIALPGLFSQAGLPSDARVIVWREIVAGPEPMALFVDRPQYAVAASWDGALVGSIGDPAAEGRDARSARSLFALLPEAPAGTRHQLALDLRGDYGKGGVLGRILVGPVQEIHLAATSTENQRLALALGLALLAALPLAVAARGAWRPTYVTYGLFALALSIQSGVQSNLASTLLPDALAVTRLLRVVTPAIGPFGVAFGALFLHGGLRGPDRALAAAALLLATAGLVLPPPTLYALEVLGEMILVTSALRFGMLAAAGLRARARGSWMLGLAVLPALWALGTEITLTHGLRTGDSHALVASLLLTVALGAALVIRDADQSEQHERLVRGSIDAMVAVNHDGRVRDANPAAHVLLAPMSDDASLPMFADESDRPVVRAHLARALSRPDRAEFRTRRGRILESLATPLGPDLAILTLRDITVQRELDRGLLQAARMEMVGVLLGGIAHDFNNMLSTMLAHLGLLRTQVPEAARERIDRMESAVDRASELTRRLLTVARGTGSELGPVDLAKVVADAVDLVEPTLPAGVTLSMDLPSDLPPVLGAAGDLEQVLVNLLVNARDTVGERGHLRIAARAFRHGEGRGVALMVEDDGPGVPADRKEEVFQPFVTSKPRGTGLGLAVSRQILHDHHGRIWLEDRPGGGARFLVALRHADMRETPVPLPERRRILLVDDEVVLLEDYERALTAAGFEVVAFSSGVQAAQWLSLNAPDMLVTDVVMPDLNGLELARRCLEQHPGTPVMFVSAFVPDENLRALPHQSWHALHKPVRTAHLVAQVARIRRRAERAAAGLDEVSWIRPLFPDLTSLTASMLGFDGTPAHSAPEPV